MAQKRLSVRDIVDGCSLEILVGEEHLSRTVTNIIASDLMSDVLAFSSPGSLLVTALPNIQSVVTANIADAVCVLYTRGKTPDQMTLQRAALFEIPLLSTTEDTFTVCCWLSNLGFACKPPRKPQ